MSKSLKSLNKAELAHIFTNAATDPGVVFSLGNGYMNFKAGNMSGFALNMATAALCFSVRLCTEFQKAGAPLPMPGFITALSANPGAALVTSGIITAASGIEPALTFDPDQIQTLYPAIIMGGLGTANILDGSAPSLRDGGALRRAFRGSAAILYAGCLTLASADAPDWVKGIFIAGGVVGLASALTNRKGLGPVSNGRMNALGCASSGLTNPNPVMLWANSLWALGYLMLDCLLNKGGPVEFAKDLISEKKLNPDEVVPYWGERPHYEEGTLYVPYNQLDLLPKELADLIVAKNEPEAAESEKPNTDDLERAPA